MSNIPIVSNTIYDIPLEIWCNILKYTDVKTISNCCCLNTRFNKFIDNNLWLLIDNLCKYTDTILIPKTIFTFNKYRYLVDWSDILLYNQQHNKSIPDYVIEWIPDIIDLEMIILYQKVSENIIRQIYPNVSWSSLLKNQKVPLDIIYCMIESQNDEWRLSNADWHYIWSKQTVDCKFVSKYIDSIQWHPLSTNKDIISHEFIYNYGENIIWHEFTKHGIHEDILQHFIHKFDMICWNNICRFTELSSEFIRKYFGHLDIGSILRYQTIPEDLLYNIINSMSSDDINMYISTIGSYQKLSKDFILHYKNMIPLRTIIKNKRVPRSIIHEIYKNELIHYRLQLS